VVLARASSFLSAKVSSSAAFNLHSHHSFFSQSIHIKSITMGVLPMAVFGLEVPAGGMPVAASGEIPAAVSFRKNLNIYQTAMLTPTAVPPDHGCHRPQRRARV
jgi:hypothetical protein